MILFSAKWILKKCEQSEPPEKQVVVYHVSLVVQWEVKEEVK